MEPLTLTLEASGNCEAAGAREALSSALRTNDRGERVRENVSLGWRVRGEVAVTWQVNGGTGPYMLMVDGESRDPYRLYEGAQGQASVGCADSSVGTSFVEFTGDALERRYDAEPTLDSGRKTISAVVTDAGGNTARAETDVYVITEAPPLGVSEPLTAGETYLIYGIWLPSREASRFESATER